MKTMKRFTVVLATALLTGMLAGPPVRASDPPPDPDNDIVSATLVQDESSLDFTTLATGSNCSTTGYHIEMKNGIGVVLAKVGVSGTHWCWRNGNVVSKSWGDPWCWTSAVTLWNCQNKDTYVEAHSKQKLPRSYVWKQWRFHLHYCLTWYCKDQWPWIYIGVRGNGTSGVNGGKG